MKLEPVIGLEIHVQLKTESKMFCACANIFGDVEPNSAVCPICMGYPGTLPVPNQKAIEWTQLVGAALGCELATESKFDRKIYFYPDLPKGYQISQYDKPFCGEGKVELTVGEKKVAIGITRAHLEEDAAKNIHPPGADYTLIDYNRAGTPLVEIVTEPDIKSPADAKAFLQELQRILRALGVSDADMEKGQLRCDANISMRERGSTKLNPKTEVKNLNSFRNVERALTFEIERQSKAYEQKEVPQGGATRGFDADKGVTVAQRTKEEAADYRYFPEPDIPPFTFTEEELRQRAVDLPELPSDKRTRLKKQFDISDDQAELFIALPNIAGFFEQAASEVQQLENDHDDLGSEEIPKLIRQTANLALRQLRKLIESQNITPRDLKISPANFAEVVVLLHQGKMNQGVIDELLAEMQKTGGDPDHILSKLGLEQVSDTADLEKIIDEVIAENEDIVEKVKAGKDAAIKALIGQVMGKTQGKANPQVVEDLLRKHLRGG